jgi:LysR family transcriptional regulator, regulator for metE and metH
LELVLSLQAAASTAGAAKALHLTQSAVSRALGQAEERVGARLFERSARGLTPTAAGRRLLAGAPAVLQHLRELERAVAAPDAVPQRLRVVCECYTAYRWLPSATASMQRRWSDLRVEVGVEHTGDPVRALIRGQVDVALLTTSELPPGAGLREEPLFSDEIVFLVSERHELAARERLSPKLLAAQTLITGAAPPAEARWFLRAVFGRSRPKLGFLRFPLTEAVVDAARAGMGVAVLSEWMASGYVEGPGSGLAVLRLSNKSLRRPWRIAYRKELATVVERLTEALRMSAPRLNVR